MNKFKDKRVLITGGASGIGKIMGRKALEKGAKLIIWDINRQNIEETVAEFSHLGEIAAYIVDVSDTEHIANAAQQVKDRFGQIDILINNAGIIVGKYFHDHNLNDINRSMNINTLSQMYVTKVFIDEMISSNSGHICNIASMAGLIANPKMSVYAASKWAVAGWSESLRLEMKQIAENVKVTTVMPYYINTGMFSGVKSTIPILKPEKVAGKIIGAIEKNRVNITVPHFYGLIRFLQGILPFCLFDLIVGKLMGIYKSMDDFKGRNS